MSSVPAHRTVTHLPSFGIIQLGVVEAVPNTVVWLGRKPAEVDLTLLLEKVNGLRRIF